MAHLSEKDIKVTDSFYIYRLSFQFKIFSSYGYSKKKNKDVELYQRTVKIVIHCVWLVYKRKEVPYTWALHES